MPVPLIVLTNGRPECISKTIPSAQQHLTGVAGMVIVDDSGDPTYGQWLEDEFIGGPWDGKVMHLPEPHGYWRAMQYVWGLARHWAATYDTSAFFFLEDDFTFNENVDLDDLAGVLDAHPYLTQMALKRQPWFPNELQHGGMLEALEAQGQRFDEISDGAHHWIEHRALFTGNPCLIPERTFRRDWPEGQWSESRFGRHLFAEPSTKGAYWGKRMDLPLVTHIGRQRVGSNY